MPPPRFIFEWNAAKAAANLGKHGVSFEEATTVLDDAFALVVDDEEHSDDEPRQILIGYSNHNRLLFISIVHREPNLVRMVSARKADAQEHQDYEEKSRF
jgi:uncharacterized DUF497 family protein